ncbi:MAG: MerR family DNA-binding transcriptional regulator [Verrucomicrobia subdivision 3 bacterium]|nr:MerR family DNA-binding transcriptional regulator [Limisphaerales bacterium]
MRPLTIGSLAKASRVHLETVRYYERVGLMPKPSRTASNYRNYGPEHVERLSATRPRRFQYKSKARKTNEHARS